MTVYEEIGYVCRMILGGPAWGLFMGILETTILSRMTNMWESEVILILSVPYVTFWFADAVFGISGALAVLVLGLWMSSHRAIVQSATARTVQRLWECMKLIADTLIYSIFGVLITETAVTHLQPEDYWMILLISLAALLVRGASFCLLQPILSRIGIGQQVFTWPHIFVLVWGGFRGAVTLSLGLLATDAGGVLANYDADVSSKVVFHSAGIVMFTNIFNASTMRYFLSKIGVLDFPLSRLISLNIALDHLREMQKEQIDIYAADHYMTDTDWIKVQELTTFDKQDFGVHPDFTKFRDVEMHFMMRQHEDSLAMRRNALYPIHPTHGQFLPRIDHHRIDHTDLHVSSDIDLKRELTPEQVKEVQSIARLRLIKAKKTSYWKQFRNGTLSQGGVELLDDLTDTLLHSEHGMVGSEDIIHHLRSEKWAGFKRTLMKFHRIEMQKYSNEYIAPSEPRRLFFYHIAISRWLEYFIYFVNIFNCSDTIADWIIHGETVEINWRTTLFLYLNVCFLLIYITEAAIKVYELGWRGYWGSTWYSWNRVDFLLLMVSCIDIIVAFVCLYVDHDEGKVVVGPAALSVLRIFRFFRLIRLLRAFQLLKPVVPFVLKFLDESVNSHLYYAFDLARAFVIGQEETNVILPTLIGYRPLIAQIKSRSQADAQFINKELGLLNEQRPDVAAAVKTRQAARSILNHTRDTVLDMHKKGVLDDDDVKVNSCLFCFLFACWNCLLKLCAFSA
ncbi:hypothetical protein RvY_17981-2 [Ramazzottius varieornatus]|uniref:Ion transport domain-containing protein n=2 Tax=Ramazzottius varieornatus TaxID=947166 RepID=A0A1D1W7Q6_RAMVA|nr:hypothetical protein RvY_17981-2 [Ramazzottius varieornatus]